MTRPWPGREWPIVWEHLDPECVPLVKALNALPGLHTQECCCGHGAGPLWVCVEARDPHALRPLLRIIERPPYHPAWRLRVESGPPRLGNVYYRLYGPAGAYDQAAAIAERLGSDDADETVLDSRNGGLRWLVAGICT